MEDKFIVLHHSMIRRTDLTMQEKIIYLEILNLSSLEKGCIASNSHFEKSFGISKKSVSNTISSLIKKGFIESEISNRNHTRVLSIKNGQVSTKDGYPSTKDGETKENKQSNKQSNKSTSLLDEYLESDNSCTELTKNKVQEFIGYRKKIKKPIKTIAPITAYIKTLRELVHEGVDIDEAIALMKESEWQTLKVDYLPKEMFKKSAVDNIKLTNGVNMSKFEKYNKG